MARPAWPRLGPALALTIGLLALAGCTQTRSPELLPETPPGTPESAQTQADEQAGGQEEAADEATSETEEEKDPSVIVIETGSARSGKSSLWEAAVAAREARKSGRTPVASVTNENLHEYQDAELTFAEPSTKEGSGDGEDGATDEQAEGEEGEAEKAQPETRGEQYWRSLVLDIRLRLRAAADEIEEIESEVGSLRRSFYAEDDPYVRDGQIKPAWDRAIGRVGTTRRRVASLRQELAEALEDGRRAGALAGWLREGIELEPSFPEEPSAVRPRDPGGLSIHESQELETAEPDEPPNTNPQEPPP